jgi:hypothetical protein
MRLSILETGFRPLQQIQLAVIKMLVGQVPGPIAVMSRGRDLFGAELAASFQQAMRRSTAWTVGEVELFAALVSKWNQCAY